MLVAELSESLEKFCCRLIDTCNSLYSFDDYGCEIAFRELGCSGLKVVERNEYYVLCSIERCLDLRIVCRCDGSGCPAVKCLSESKDFGFSSATAERRLMRRLSR